MTTMVQGQLGPTKALPEVGEEAVAPSTENDRGAYGSPSKSSTSGLCPTWFWTQRGNNLKPFPPSSRRRKAVDCLCLCFTTDLARC